MKGIAGVLSVRAVFYTLQKKPDKNTDIQEA